MKLRGVALVLGLMATLLVQIAETAPVSAYPTANVEFIGHGFGHGRGLSQYGSLGYAKDLGWNSNQILDHYYGGTEMGTVGNSSIGVRIVGNDNADLIVRSNSDFTVGGRTYVANKAARIRRTGSGQFKLDEGSGCAGPWSEVASVGATTVLAVPANGNQGPYNPNINQLLERCTSDGNVVSYRGNLKAVDTDNVMRIVNDVLLEDYLLGVVPRESPASWASMGGAEALKAQAVAARSYSIATQTYPYATTCDTTSCQVYGGVAKNGAVIEDDRSTAAIIATAGQVRRFPDASIARTEFSSSSGGLTAGGVFPAVVDEGDATASNPNHTWTASVPVATIEAAYPSIGSLKQIVFNNRDGRGEWGGRVTSMTLVGSNANVTTSGYSFRGQIGGSTIKSDWFNINYQPSGGVNGYWMMGNDGGIFSFGGAQFYGSMGGKRLNQPVVGLSPTTDAGGYWLVASDGGVFAFGNAPFFGSMGGQRLNKPVVTMTPTPTGLGYWQVASDGGIFAFGDAQFYGSMGGQRLNQPIVSMASTPTGKGYWLVASDGGIFAFGDAQFYGSTGGMKINRPIIGMASTADGGGYWLVAADGGIFAFGNATYLGSMPGSKESGTASGITATTTGKGYIISETNGEVHSFGDAPYFGDMATAVIGFRGTITGIARG